MRWDRLIVVLWTWLFKGDRDETVGGAPRSRGLRAGTVGAGCEPASEWTKPASPTACLAVPVLGASSGPLAVGNEGRWIFRPVSCSWPVFAGRDRGQTFRKSLGSPPSRWKQGCGAWAPPTLGLPLFVCLFGCLSSFWFLYRPHYITSLCNVARLLWELALPILCALLTGAEGIWGF